MAQFLCNHRIYVVSDVGILELLIWIRLDLVPKLRSHLIFLTLHLVFFFQLLILVELDIAGRWLPSICDFNAAGGSSDTTFAYT